MPHFKSPLLQVSVNNNEIAGKTKYSDCDDDDWQDINKKEEQQLNEAL